MNEFCEALDKTLAGIGAKLSEEKLSALCRYYELLSEKNKVMNLTAITKEEDFIIKHVLDALSLVAFTKAGEEDAFKSGLRVIDVGTGAGIPGLVLKIAHPQIDMTLLDSLKKRLGFLDEAIGELGLSGIRTVHGRAEDAGHDRAHREKYGLSLARAVAHLSVLSEYCLPFVELGGYFTAYKTAGAAAEAKEAGRAIRLLGGEIAEIKEFVLPGTDLKRAFVTVRKVKETPSKYPRKAGTPSREPL